MGISRPYYRWQQVKCASCGTEWKKREDSLSVWRGHCRSCAMKAMAQLPGIQTARRENGRKVMERVGKLPRAQGENIPRGDKHYNWRGGITPTQMKIRNSVEMAKWRKSVFARDGFKCQICGINDHNLHADHIKPFAAYPDLRFDIDNGRTLCRSCHRQHGAIVRLGAVVREAAFLKIDDGTNWRIG